MGIASKNPTLVCYDNNIHDKSMFGARYLFYIIRTIIKGEVVSVYIPLSVKSRPYKQQ